MCITVVSPRLSLPKTPQAECALRRTDCIYLKHEVCLTNLGIYLSILSKDIELLD